MLSVPQSTRESPEHLRTRCVAKAKGHEVNNCTAKSVGRVPTRPGETAACHLCLPLYEDLDSQEPIFGELVAVGQAAVVGRVAFDAVSAHALANERWQKRDSGMNVLASRQLSFRSSNPNSAGKTGVVLLSMSTGVMVSLTRKGCRYHTTNAAAPKR